MVLSCVQGVSGEKMSYIERKIMKLFLVLELNCHTKENNTKNTPVILTLILCTDAKSHNLDVKNENLGSRNSQLLL